jgi:response regulator RpfG family c-di-GMP phosphodiesterase
MRWTVLVVEDDDYVRASLERLLRHHGYRVLSAPDANRALAFLRQQPVDLVLTDLRIRPIDGLDLLGHIQMQYRYIPVIILTGYGSLDSAIRALRYGARDYLLKPCDPRVLLERVHAVLTDIPPHEGPLPEAIAALARALSVRDPETYRHSRRVACFAQQIARRMAMPPEERQRLGLAGLLHDIGKLGIRSALLHKPGPLTAQEYREIQAHPILSVHILRPITALESILPAVLHHHERFDGRGYPDGLAGEEIPLAARVLAVADSFAAMTERRPYRPARSPEQPLLLLQQGAGQQWDPLVVRSWVHGRWIGRVHFEVGKP